jgi:phospholipase/carboxylesterase
MSRDSYVYRERLGRSGEAPLLFLFHGTGGDEDQFFDVGGQLLPGAHLMAVRGDVSEHGALRYFRRTAEGVYDMADLGLRTGKLVDFVRAHVGETHPDKVFGLGYSNGANILAAAMIAAPDLFDGAVLMHPLIPFDPDPAPGLKGRHMLLTAGRRDPIAPAAASEALAGYFARQGADLAVHWHDGGHELRQEEFSAAQLFLRQAAI